MNSADEIAHSGMPSGDQYFIAKEILSMSLSIGSSLASLYTQQLLTSRGSQASSGSSLPNMEDTYTPSLAHQNSTDTLIHQMKSELQVQVDTAVTAQQDATMSNVMAMFGISNS